METIKRTKIVDALQRTDFGAPTAAQRLSTS